MTTYRGERRLPPDAIVQHGDTNRCGHAGCSTAVSVYIPLTTDSSGQPMPEGTLTVSTLTDSGLIFDSQYRYRCDSHNDRVRPPIEIEQLEMF